MPQNQRFEIPQELRQLAEENVERARQLYLRFMEGVDQAMAVWSAPSPDVIAPGFTEVRARAAKFAKENAEAAFKLAREVANAKDLQELLTLQSHYVQSQMRWYARQTEQFGQLMATAFTHLQQPPVKEQHDGSRPSAGGQTEPAAPGNRAPAGTANKGKS